jgi:hypothetical protein
MSFVCVCLNHLCMPNFMWMGSVRTFWRDSTAVFGAESHGQINILIVKVL